MTKIIIFSEGDPEALINDTHIQVSTNIKLDAADAEEIADFFRDEFHLHKARHQARELTPSETLDLVKESAQ